jgi:hypothetical protein
MYSEVDAKGIATTPGSDLQVVWHIPNPVIYGYKLDQFYPTKNNGQPDYSQSPQPLNGNLTGIYMSTDMTQGGWNVPCPENALTEIQTAVLGIFQWSINTNAGVAAAVGFYYKTVFNDGSVRYDLAGYNLTQIDTPKEWGNNLQQAQSQNSASLNPNASSVTSSSGNATNITPQAANNTASTNQKIAAQNGGNGTGSLPGNYTIPQIIAMINSGNIPPDVLAYILSGQNSSLLSIYQQYKGASASTNTSAPSLTGIFTPTNITIGIGGILGLLTLLK